MFDKVLYAPLYFIWDILRTFEVEMDKLVFTEIHVHRGVSSYEI